MRILMVTDDVQIDRRILLEAESLVSLGHEVILIAENDNETEHFQRIGNVKVERMHYLGYTSFEYNIVKLFNLFTRIIEKISTLLIRINQRISGYVLKTFHLLRSFPSSEKEIVDRIIFYRPDIIHVHDLPRLRVGAKAKKALKTPLIYDAHEIYPDISTLTFKQKVMLRRREKRYLKSVDKVITVNEFLADVMAEQYRIETPQVILNATKWPEEMPRDKYWNKFRESFDIPENNWILLFQGWMSSTRGLQLLVKAMSQVRKNVHLVFMGYGQARAELENIVAEKNLKNRVHFMDAVPQGELMGWTSSADAGIIPYQAIDLNNYYCSPNKLFEFIQAELPIIGNDLPFLRKIIVDEGFGLVHRLETVDDYSQAINSMFDQSNSNLQTYKENLKRGKDKYHWSVEEQKLYAIYHQILPITPSADSIIQ